MTDFSTTTPYLLIYFLAINLVAFVMYGIDKWKARRGKWRISEASLLGVAALGGSIGAWVGMKAFHHKTQHKKFYIGLPLIMLLQAVAAYFVMTRLL